MIIWQVKYSRMDVNHKLFCVAKDYESQGKTKRSSTVIRFEYAKKKSDGYYFYLELIK